jgi:hypothetical protein
VFYELADKIRFSPANNSNYLPSHLLKTALNGGGLLARPAALHFEMFARNDYFYLVAIERGTDKVWLNNHLLALDRWLAGYSNKAHAFAGGADGPSYSS